MAFSRVAKNSGAATITHTWYVGETPTDPTGTPTYDVVDANGTAVTSGNAAITGGSTGTTTFSLASQTITRLLTVTWVATVGGVSRTEVDHVEIVSDYYWTLAAGRASDASLADTSKYPTAALVEKRVEVEVECELICDRAFLPRYRRLVLDGTGTDEIVVLDADLRTLRRASIAPEVDETFVDLTAGELAAVAIDTELRVLRRTDGGAWDEGSRNIVVEYEFGLDRPAPDLVWATKQRLRSRLNMAKTGVPDRAVSFTVEAGGTYRLAMPGAYATGIPEIDAVYARYSLRPIQGSGQDGSGGRSVPASRQLDYTPQRWSIFHGSR